VALLCITHVLPLACKSDGIVRRVFLKLKGWEWEQDFHVKWTLDGWNDHIIQPARDAVLNYYKVGTYHLYSAYAKIHIIKFYSTAALRRAI